MSLTVLSLVIPADDRRSRAARTDHGEGIGVTSTPALGISIEVLQLTD